MPQLIIREIRAKNILSKSKILDYTINPYIGCQHGCTYCFARFIKRFTDHKEPWGKFVDVKINAPDLLRQEIKKKPVGNVWISGMCDPYQPLERKYKLTKKCLEILSKNKWPVSIQTKSPLVLRDIELLKSFDQIEVGFSIATADDGIRKFFEPNVPPIGKRIDALEKLHSVGIKTYAMIAPILPRAENLVKLLIGKVDYVIIDRMNYHYADWVYRKYKLEYAMIDEFFNKRKEELVNGFKKEGISCHLSF